MKKQKVHMLVSKLLSGLPGIVHGFTDKTFGDMRRSGNRDTLLVSLGFGTNALVWPEQIHGTAVYKVTIGDMGKIIKRVDALAYAISERDRQSALPVLAVHAADCVPLLLVDPVAKVIATAHAGWRGTLAGITQSVVLKMKDLGATAEHIRVFLGPHIGPCCYDVSEGRAQQFRNRFGNDASVIRYKHGKVYIDLGKANCDDLTIAGIKEKHIDMSRICTSCENEKYYSYRKEKDGDFGEIMGFVGFQV